MTNEQIKAEELINEINGKKTGFTMVDAEIINKEEKEMNEQQTKEGFDFSATMDSVWKSVEENFTSVCSTVKKHSTSSKIKSILDAKDSDVYDMIMQEVSALLVKFVSKKKTKEAAALMNDVDTLGKIIKQRKEKGFLDTVKAICALVFRKTCAVVKGIARIVLDSSIILTTMTVRVLVHTLGEVYYAGAQIEKSVVREYNNIKNA